MQDVCMHAHMPAYRNWPLRCGFHSLCYSGPHLAAFFDSLEKISKVIVAFLSLDSLVQGLQHGLNLRGKKTFDNNIYVSYK